MSLFRRKQDEIPTLQPSDRWIGVMGTFAYPDAVKAGQRKYEERDAIGELVPVTEGKWTGAVAVFVDGHQVGSVPKELAPIYFPFVQDLNKKRTKATVWISFDRGDAIFMCGEPTMNEGGGTDPHVAPSDPGALTTDFKSIPTFATDPSWIAWPTLLEKHQSMVPLYGGHKGPKVPSIIKEYGNLILVRFQIEPKGRSAGAIQCWVGSTMICLAENMDETAFQAVIESLAADGQPATCRGTLQHLTDFDAFSIFGRPERRPDDAPFLPPEDVVTVDVAVDELQRLDDTMNSKAKTKAVRRVGTLVNHSGATWLSLDGAWTGRVVGETRGYVDSVFEAGLPATCSVILRRQPDKPLAVTVEIPGIG